MMSHDEIRVLNWCDACQRRGLDAGALLADNARTCVNILRQVNPGGRIYVWSDMFDPQHNAHKDYYLVRGDLTGSWEGLDQEVIVVPWYFEKRAQSLKFFAQRGIARWRVTTPAGARARLARRPEAVPGVMSHPRPGNTNTPTRKVCGSGRGIRPVRERDVFLLRHGFHD
jgi:hypothetical protein